jgi:nicotinate-nucleotide adenylyltransferase
VTNVGLLGGSFNPIHVGHLVLAEEARERLALQRILLVPNRVPPHKAKNAMAPAEHRLRMVELASAGNPGLEPSDIELRREGESYSLHTVEQLIEEHGDWAIHFLIGADTLPELPTWYRIRELAGCASSWSPIAPAGRWTALMRSARP